MRGSGWGWGWNMFLSPFEVINEGGDAYLQVEWMRLEGDTMRHDATTRL